MEEGMGKSSPDCSKIEEDQVMSKTLPDELVERILAMLPFPSIMKSRYLSESWVTRLEPISSLDDQEKKLLAKAFQTKVAKLSNSWGIFSPVCKTETDLIGYDQVSGKWQRLPSLSSLPRHALPTKSGLQVEGALLYWTSEVEHSERKPISPFSRDWEDLTPSLTPEGKPRCMQDRLYVANILTLEWKKLPPLPAACLNNYSTGIKLVSDASSGTYKVIRVCHDYDFSSCAETYYCSIHIYDSKSEKWSSKDLDNELEHLDINPNISAYLNGVVYIMAEPCWWDSYLRDFVAFNVEKGTIARLTLRFDGEVNFDLQNGDDVRLLVCDAKLVMIVIKSGCCTVHVLQIDLELLRMWEVARCARNAFRLDITSICISELNCMFFELSESDGLMLAYSKDEDEWSFFSFPRTPFQWSAISFQPSLNPFMRV